MASAPFPRLHFGFRVFWEGLGFRAPGVGFWRVLGLGFGYGFVTLFRSGEF